MHCFVPLDRWIIFHCIYVAHLHYPFLCWRIFRLRPCLGCSKWCYKEHSGVALQFQLPASMWAHEYWFQSGVYRVVAPMSCGSHSIQSDTDLLLHPPLTTSNASLLSQSSSPIERGLPQMWESFSCFSSPTPGCRPSPSFPLFPSTFCISFYLLKLGSI